MPNLEFEASFELLEGALGLPGSEAAFIEEHFNDDWIRQLTENRFS
jgi:hypothetical protein